MSTDWNVYCLDCADTHHFNDANHRDEDMALLCKHADAIAGMASLVNEASLDITLGTYFGNIDPHWFARHKGHKLVPISEYGEILGQCPEQVDCGCGNRTRCTLDANHDGEHDPTSRENRKSGGPRRAVTRKQVSAMLRLLLAAEIWSDAKGRDGIEELVQRIGEARQAMSGKVET